MTANGPKSIVHGSGESHLKMHAQMRSWLISRDFPRDMGRSGIILCLVIVSVVSFEGCAQDDEEAVRRNQAAAEQGDAEAQYNLAAC